MRYFFLAFLTLTGACATDQAARLRKEKPVTVGYPGAAYRPTDSVTAGASFSLTSDGGSVPLDAVVDKDINRKFEGRGQAVSGFVLAHPWTTSAFYIGAGISQGRGEYSYQVKPSESYAAASDARSTGVRVQREQTSIIAPLGWYWIWNSGFTLNFDFGASYTVSNKVSYLEDGGANADTADRDHTREEFEGGSLSLGGARSVIGWSF